MEINDIIAMLELKLGEQRAKIAELERSIAHERASISDQVQKLEGIFRVNYPLLNEMNIKREE